jgi:hypothetical protein
VEIQTLPDVDSLTFYVRFLDSLTLPWWLQQALPVDEHLSWAGTQYQNLKQGIAGLKQIVSQSGDPESILLFQKFESQLGHASQELATSVDRLSASNEQLAQAVSELDQLKLRVLEVVRAAPYDPAFRAILVQSVLGLHQGMRGFQSLFNGS